MAFGQERRRWFGRKSARSKAVRQRVKQLHFEELERFVLLSTFTVTNTNSSGVGSFAQAVADANNAGGGQIDFNIGGGGPQTIPTSGVNIAKPIVINGASQPNPDSAAYPLIELQGTGDRSGVGLLLSAGSDGSIISGLFVSNFNLGIGIVSAGNTIGGTTPGARNVISDNERGIEIDYATATGNVVEGNYIGTDRTGATALANGFGVVVDAAASNNRIGGTTPAARNVISGNLYGVCLSSAGATGNVVEGNYIGTDVTGTTAVANTVIGVLVQYGASNNLVGGTTAGSGNVISGNGYNVFLASAGTTGNHVAGNLIGLSADGLSLIGTPLANYGVTIGEGASGNTIGGTTAGARNVIAGSIRGVSLQGVGVTANVVQGNYIGTDATGTLVLGNTTGVRITGGASANSIGGAGAGAGNLIAGNSNGVYIDGAGTSNNTVAGNFVGTNAAGTAALGNTNGVLIYSGASGNVIGGTAAGAGNLISGNVNVGVLVSDVGTSNNWVQGNLIGTDVSGALPLPNGGLGIRIQNGGSGNVIGGTVPGSGNVISSNANYGVHLIGSGVTNNLVAGNFIGVDVTGTQLLANPGVGILISAGASHNTIGGTTSSARNVINGSNYGIEIYGLDADDNVVQGNYLGSDVSGTLALGNGCGVLIGGGAKNNLIGGTTTGARNLIAGDGGYGVSLADAGTAGNAVQGNFIGTDLTGAARLGTLQYGVVVGQGASNNTFGGTAAGAGNVIAFTEYTAVVIGGNTSDLATGNAVLGNSIFNAGAMGIDLANDWITANAPGGPHSGPNRLQNKPVLTSAKSSPTSTIIEGTLNSAPNATFRVELFVSPTPSLTGYGLGKVYLGFVNVTTDGSGNATFLTTFPATSGSISATATDANGNTSEFAQSLPVKLVPAQPILRTAILKWDGKVTVTWDDVAGETGYRVERSANGSGVWTVVGTVGAGVTTLTDAGPITAPLYAYRLYAVNADGDSEASVPLHASTNTTTGGGTTTATWTFGNLTPGRYLVAVNWEADDARAANAPYTVLGGTTVLGTAAVNQRRAPGDFTAAGVLWHELGVYAVAGDTLSVRLDDLAIGSLNTDAVFLRRIDEARAEVFDGAARVSDSLGKVEFGVVPIDQPAVRIFTVRNTGAQDLHLTGPIQLPAGFSLVADFGTTTLAPGASTTFAVRYNAAAGAASGLVGFDTDDPDQGRYEFTVAGWASKGRIIDDGEAGFATTGSWWPLAYPGSRFKGDFRIGNATVYDGSSTATWTFDNLTPGQYRIAVTWESAADRATNAPFTVLNGTTVLGTTAVNQKLAPAGFTDAGTSWYELGVYTVTGATLAVRLNDLADGFVIADAVYIERVEPAPTYGLDLSVVPQLPATARIGTGVRSLASFRFTTGAAADYTASISWGDGSTTVGTVVAGPGGTGIVLGGHTYLDAGSDVVSVTVSGHGVSTTASTTIQVGAFGSGGTGEPGYNPWPEPGEEIALNGLVLAPIQGQAAVATLALIVGASSNTASDFSGTVDWGDGTTSAVAVVASPAGDGRFLVTASHAYAWTGAFTTLISIQGNGVVYIAYGKALVDGPKFTATTVPMTGSVGQVWSGVVATVTAADPDVVAGNLLATIDWGDGHVTPGLVVARSATVFDVVGVNVYGTAGAFPVAVYVSDLEGSTMVAGGAATIAGMPLSAFGQPLSFVAGVSFSGLVATLINPNPGAQASQMTATIDWGDGTTSTGSIVADSTSGKFHITGSKTYAKSGKYTVTVQIADEIGGQATAIADAVVVGAAVTATGRNTSAVEGSPFNGVVASFTVPNASASASDFTATIWWGDGFASTGTITRSGGQFEVTGAHTYSTYGAYAIGVQISDGSNGVVAQGKITVAGAGLTVTGRPVVAVEGSPFNGVVATFVDANPASRASQFKAVITWGDGQQSLGTIQADPAGGGLYSVVGSHLYSTTGSFPVMVQVSDVGGASGSASGTATVAVSVLAVAAPSISAAANQAFSVAVTTFTKAGAYSSADFTATINWGDGTSSSGTISSSGVAGEFIVSGSHTYASIGSYTVSATVTLTPGSGGSAVGSGTASVSNTTASARSIVATAGASWSGAAAAFSTTDLGLTAASFTATIDWGDGVSTAGVVASTGTAGQFQVTGTHTYGVAGAFAAVVRITDPAGRVASTVSTAVVADPAVNVTAVAPAATEGLAFSGDVATFTAAGAQAASYFGATIRWGDGSTSVGVVVPAGTPGQYKVTGTHVYGQRGTYPVTVQVISQGGSSGESSTTAVVAKAPFAVQAVAVSARTGAPFSGLVATFTSAPARLANAFTATITWGDGTSSAGTVIAPSPTAGAGAGVFQVKGTHTYAAAGSYTVSIQIVDAADGSSRTATGAAKAADVAGVVVAAYPVVGTPYTGTIATFSGTTAAATGATATINWGDGTTTAGTITADPAAAGVYRVAGSHAYATVGSKPVSVQITNAAGSIELVGTATVLAAPLVVSPSPFNATAGVAFSGEVARFRGGSGVVAGTTATIEWGDGAISTGVVAAATTAGGSNVVTSSHAYASVGTYTVTVTITQADGTSAVAVGSVEVTNMTVSGAALSLSEGAPFTGVVASFTNAGSSLTASSYKAIIDWGDGRVTAGTVTADPAGNGKLNVEGAVVYTAPGPKAVTVRVVDPAGRVTVIYATANVAAAVVSAAGEPVEAVRGTLFTGEVASFTSTNPRPDLHAFAATIAWGDGSTTTGEIMADPAVAGRYLVIGSHTYLVDGSYAVSIQVAQADGAPVAAATTATVAAAAVPVSFAGVQARAGVLYTGAVATFVAWPGATAGSFAATIDWGDGTTSTGVVAPPTAPGQPFTISGSHTYAATGVYEVTVAVAGAAQGSVSGDANVASVTAAGATVASVVGAIFSGTVASFGDPTGSSAAADFQALIDWGDGSTSPGVVTAVGGGFNVAGMHTYAAVGSYVTTVRILQASGASVQAVGAATVVAATLVLTATPPFAIAGTSFHGVVATFVGGSGTLVGATAVIDWGDGTTSNGTIAGPTTPGGPNTVSGTHTYAAVGSYSVTVTVVDPTAAVSRSITGSASVSDVTASGLTMYEPIEGYSYSDSVATFSSANSALTESDFTATIDWGDGTTSAGAVTLDYFYGGGFSVSGSHTYARAGTYQRTVRIVEPGGYTAKVTTSIRVANAYAYLYGDYVSASPGVVFSGTIATLTDDNTLATAGEYSASILWSDGVKTAGAVAPDPSSPGRFFIKTSRVFAQSGSYSAAVTVVDAAGNTTTGSGSADVSAPPLSVSVQSVKATASTPFSGLVAQITADATTAASAFTVTIDWGDGTTSPGSVAAPAIPGGPFVVTGVHTYTTNGSYSVSVSVTGPTGTTSSWGSATVSSLSVAAAAVTATAGVGFNGVVASFVDANPSATPASATVTINWGDGTTSAGSIVPNSGSAGVYDVVGNHTYNRFGAYVISIVVTDNIGSGSATGAASVADAPLNAYGTTFQMVEGAATTLTVATFQSRVPGAGVADYSAAIDWGDGRISAGTIVADPAGGGYFNILGTHAYKEPGSRPVSVTVLSVGGSKAVANSAVAVADAAIAATALNLAPTEGAAFSGVVVATFRDANPFSIAADFTATIDWGDGASSAGKVVGDAINGYTVTATQTYRTAGTFPVAVQIGGKGGGSTVARSSAVVADAPLYAGTLATTLKPTEGSGFTDVVATFTDANPYGDASTFTATVDWGDGTTSTGTVSANSAGGFDVSATHTYARAGYYDVTVQIVGTGGSTLNTSTTAQVADAPLTGLEQTLTSIQGSAFTGAVASFTDADPNGVASRYTATIQWGDGTTSSGTIVAASGRFGTFDVTGTHTYAYAATYPVTVIVSSVDGQWVQVASTMSVASSNAVTRTVLESAAEAVNAGMNGSSSGAATTSIDLGVGSFVPLIVTSSSGSSGGPSGDYAGASFMVTAGSSAPVSTSYSQVFKIHEVGSDYVLDQIVTVAFSQVVVGNSFTQSFTLTTWSHYHQTQVVSMGGVVMSTMYDETLSTSDVMTAAGAFTIVGGLVSISGVYSTTESTNSTWMLSQSFGGGAVGIGVGGVSTSTYTASGTNATSSSDAGSYTITNTTSSIAGAATASQSTTSSYSSTQTGSLAAVGGISVTNFATTSGTAAQGFTSSSFYSRSGGGATVVGTATATLSGNNNATALAIQTGDGFGMATSSANASYSGTSNTTVARMGAIATSSITSNLSVNTSGSSNVMLSGTFTQGNSNGSFTYSANTSESASTRVTDSRTSTGGVTQGSTIAIYGSNQSTSSSFASMGSYSTYSGSGMFSNSSTERNASASNGTETIVTMNGVKSVSGSYSSSSDQASTTSSNVDGMYNEPSNVGTFSQTSFNTGTSSSVSSGGYASSPDSYSENGSSRSISTNSSTGTYSDSGTSTSTTNDGYGYTVTVDRYTNESGGGSSSTTISSSNFSASNTGYASSGVSATTYNGSSSSSSTNQGTTVVSSGAGGSENITYQSSSNSRGVYDGTETVAFSAGPESSSVSGTYSQSSSGGGASSYSATNQYSTVPMGSGMESDYSGSSGGTFTYSSTSFSTYDNASQGSFDDSGESGSYTSSSAGSSVTTTSDVGTTTSTGSTSGSTSHYTSNTSQKSAGESSTAGTYSSAGASGTTQSSQTQTGVQTATDDSSSWNLGVVAGGSAMIGGGSSTSNSNSSVSSSASSQNTTNFSPGVVSGTYSSNQTQKSKTTNNSSSSGTWIGWSQSQTKSGDGSTTSETVLTYQDSGTFNGAGSTGRSTFTSINTTTSDSSSKVKYTIGQLKGNRTQSSSSSTSTSSSWTNNYSPGASDSTFNQIQTTKSKATDKGSETTTGSNSKSNTYTWDVTNDSDGKATAKGSTTGGVTTQDQHNTVTTDTRADYSEKDSYSTVQGDNGETRSSSWEVKERNKSVNKSDGKSTIGAWGEAVDYDNTVSGSTSQSYTYTNQLTTTSKASNSTQSTSNESSSTESYSYSASRETTTTSRGGQDRSNGSTTTFSNTRSLVQTTTDTGYASSSLERNYSTEWSESTRSESDSFSYSYSDSGESQGGDSSGPVQWNLTGSKEQEVSQSWTASLSSSKSTQYTTTIPGDIDPETGYQTAITVTNTSLTTKTSTYSEDFKDVVSGNFGAETQTKTTNSGSTSDTKDEENYYGAHRVTIGNSRSTSSQTMTYNNASQSGEVNGGSSSSWTTTINGTATHGPATQPPPYHYTLSSNYSPSDSGTETEPSGGGGVPWLERLGLGTNPAAAFVFGLFQGATNIANGVTQIVGGGDWSRGAFVYESDGAHSLSKNLGGQGASILLMGGLGQATIIAKVGCLLNNPVFKGVGLARGIYGAGSELGEFAQAVSNGDGYGAVEHGGLALMGLLDVAAAFGQACFAAGTPIMTRDGAKAIEEIRPGDYVLSAPEDDPDAIPSFRLVEEVFQTYSPLMEVRVEGRSILTTSEHPFWVQGRGWTNAQELNAGDLLRTDDGRWLAIEDVGRPCDPSPVYNMRVADYHTYFVGSEEWGFSVWAHNASYPSRVSGRNPPISPRQAIHTNGTPNKSQFNPGVDVEGVVRMAWEAGVPRYGGDGRIIGKVFEFKNPVGTSPAGYPQRYVKVHWSPNKGIHGVPSANPSW